MQVINGGGETKPSGLLFWLRRNVPWVYLLRFPLILASILLALVPLGLLWIPTMFRNLFILPGGGVTLVALFATLAAATVHVTRRVTLLYGPERFGVLSRGTDRQLSVLTVIVHALLAAPLIVATVWLSAGEGRLGWFTASLMALRGVVVAALVVWCAELLQAWMTSAEVELPELAVPHQLAMDIAHRRQPPTMPSWIRRFLHWLRPLLGPGYLAQNGDLLPGHTFTTAFLIVYASVYGLGYFLWRPGTALGAGMPALVSVLIVATLWIWVLAGLAFYLDRHRVPILLPIVLTSMFLWTTSHSDYYFDLVQPSGDWALLEDPSAIARKRQHDLLTVVAVDGGGIQAAAWGARVLTGIQEKWPAFSRSARFISAVSGGSVGTMYFVGSLRPDAPPTSQELSDIVAFAKRGSLNEAGWGFAYPDLWRAVIPIPEWFRFEKDRGWAMQRAWERGWRERAPQLSDWVRGVNEGWRPATSFNAVAVESGQRFSFGTFAPPYQWGIGTVERAYAGLDVSVSTAARLSATFPYVTPIARGRPAPNVRDKRHFADGGYYDNTGMGLAMRWLDRALWADAAAYEGKAVAFIRIRSSPTGIQKDPKDRGWQYQVVGPIQALMSVRVAAQRERAESELEFLQRLWCLQKVDIRKFEFAFETAEPRSPPLSWQLSPEQQEDIELEWSGTHGSRSDRNQATLRDLIALAEAPVQACRTGAAGAGSY
jgi:Patatin-like phospholipase